MKYFDWSESNVRPFYLTARETVEQRYDWEEQMQQIVDKTKQDICYDLTRDQIQKIVKEDFTLSELQDLAMEHNISLHKSKVLMRPGWVGAPKGLLQVLWEPRWIDKENYKDYQWYARDHSNALIKEFSLIPLMGSCLDFA